MLDVYKENNENITKKTVCYLGHSYYKKLNYRHKTNNQS